MNNVQKMLRRLRKVRKTARQRVTVDPNSSPIEGYVERIDEVFGVEGWAVDRRNPSLPIEVELWAGNHRLAVTRTGLPRPDVNAVLNVQAAGGFRFDADVRDAICDAARNGVVGGLSVRAAGASADLPLLCTPRSLDKVRDTAPANPIDDTDQFFQQLRHQQQHAIKHLGDRLVPVPESAAGVVEAICVDSAGPMWISGWITEDLALDRALVIQDRGSFPGALGYAAFRREDLPAGHVGFIGIMQTNWRPGAELPPYMFFADGSGNYLDTPTSSISRTAADMAPVIRSSLAKARGRYADILRTMFFAADQWGPGHATDDLVYVDQCSILPGFGVIVDGWALSPSKEAVEFSLKASGHPAAHQEHVVRRDRPDLATLLPNIWQGRQTAGVFAIFRVPFGDDFAGNIALKVTWSDGSNTITAISPKTIRTLGRTATIESVWDQFHALEAEPFFGDFAHHAALATQSRQRQVISHAVQPTLKALVIGLPANWPDLFLAFDNVTRNNGHLQPDWGIALIAGSTAARAPVVALFAELQKSLDRPTSLFFTSTAQPTNDAISAVIADLGADRFAFTDHATLLHEHGWQAIGGTDEQFALLGVCDPALPEGIGNNADLSAFVSTTRNWLAIAAHARPQIGGIILPPDITQPPVIPNAALKLGHKMLPAYAARINSAATGPNHD